MHLAAGQITTTVGNVIGIISFEEQQLLLHVVPFEPSQHENAVAVCVNIVMANNAGNKFVPIRQTVNVAFYMDILQ